MNRTKILSLTRGAVIAALYFLLTLLSFGFASGAVQCRLAEALCVLPAFLPEAVPGLFIGCLLSNLLGGNVFDIVIGSTATLIGAIGTRCLRKTKHRVLLPIPTVVANSLLIPVVLFFLTDTAFSYGAYFGFAGTVFLGECVSALLLGTVLDRLLLRSHIFKRSPDHGETA